jgi:hypothetical protein
MSDLIHIVNIYLAQILQFLMLPLIFVEPLFIFLTHNSLKAQLPIFSRNVFESSVSVHTAANVQMIEFNQKRRGN